MKLIFIDEAGTSGSPHEVVTIVAGVMVDEGEQHSFLKVIIARAFDQFVPERYRENFIFHAYDVFGTKYREGWTVEARKNLLLTMMFLPRMFGLPLCMGMRRRTAPGVFPEELENLLKSIKVSLAQYDHLLPFMDCIVKADARLIHEGPNIFGRVIAEDVPDVKKILLKAGLFLKNSTLVFEAQHQEPTQKQVSESIQPEPFEFKISRIDTAINFENKSGDPVLQVADACAFGLRRFFSNQPMGEEFAQHMLGEVPNLKDYECPVSSSCWSPS